MEIELTPEAIATEQRNDPALKLLIDSLSTTNQRPAWVDIQSESEETKALWAQFNSLKVPCNTATTVLFKVWNRNSNANYHA